VAVKTRCLHEFGLLPSVKMSTGTNRSVSLYYGEISRITPVSDPQEERRLIHRWQKHRDIKARDALVRSHLRFVVTLARKRSRDPDRLQDLIASGNIGLIKALDRFDLKRTPPIRFLTYAGFWINKEISDEDYATSSLVRVPTHRQKAQRKQAKIFQRAVQAHGPDARQVKKMDPGAPEGVTVALEIFHDAEPTMTPSREAHEVDVDRSNLLLRRAIGQLPLREQTVLNLYFGVKDDPRNLVQIASILGMSPERVRQIKINGVKQLRSSLKARTVFSSADVF